MRLPLPAPDPAPKLMQLGQPEPLGVLHDHDRRVGDIHSDFDDCGRDKDVDRARDERVHDAVLGAGLHAPVEERHPVCGEHFGLQVVGHLGGGLEIDLLGAFDQRVDDVRLAPGVDLFANEIVNLVAPRLGLDPGPNRRPARGQVGNLRDIQFTVIGQRQRARDRSRRHQQGVGPQALRPQCRPLRDAEAVLLVDDDQAELVERDRLLHQRVRADDQVRGAPLDVRVHGVLLQPRRAPR